MTIKEELVAFAKQLLKDMPYLDEFISEYENSDRVHWLSKAIFESHIFAIYKNFSSLKGYASGDQYESLKKIEFEMICAEIKKYANKG